MKFYFAILALALAFAARADMTPTNSVKGSALPTATTPLAGTESVFLIQSGATKTATVGQVIAAATGQANSFSNALAVSLAAEIAARSNSVVTASNSLAAQIASNAAATATATAGASNAAAAALSAATAAAAQDTTASNYFSGQIEKYYPASNPNNYQTAAQVATSISSNTATVGNITASNVTYVVQPPQVIKNTNTSAINITNDLSAGSFQQVTIDTNAAGGGTAIYLYVKNPAAGQSVTVLLTSQNTSTHGVYISSPVRNLVTSGTGTGASAVQGKPVIISYTSVDSNVSNVLFSCAYQH